MRCRAKRMLLTRRYSPGVMASWPCARAIYATVSSPPGRRSAPVTANPEVGAIPTSYTVGHRRSHLRADDAVLLEEPSGTSSNCSKASGRLAVTAAAKWRSPASASDNSWPTPPVSPHSATAMVRPCWRIRSATTPSYSHHPHRRPPCRGARVPSPPAGQSTYGRSLIGRLGGQTRRGSHPIASVPASRWWDCCRWRSDRRGPHRYSFRSTPCISACATQSLPRS